MSFEGLHAEYMQWVKATFPDETPREQYVHLCEEFDELCDNLSDAAEYADVMMLLFCVAANNGVDIFKAFAEKFEINKARAWKLTERGMRHE